VLRLGVSFRETLRGSYWRLDAPTEERALDVVIDARTPSLAELRRDRVFLLCGHVTAEGLAVGAVAEGTLVFKLIHERRFPYRVRFRGDDGRRYELSGQKEWMPFAPIESVTTLPASLYDADGQEIGRATLRFDVRNEVIGLLRSLRVRLHT
jgi:hypothetical protein